MRSVAIALLLLAPTRAFAGWTAVQVSSSGGNKSEANMFYDAGKLRIDAGQKSYVLEFKTDVFIFIDHEGKRYAVSSLDEVVALQKKILETMKKSIGQLPPQQRQLAEAQIARLEKGAKAKAPDVKKTGKKDQVNGYACDVVTWTDDFGNNEACIAEKMPVDMKTFLAESAALSKRLGEKGASNATPTQALFQLPGFPVRTQRKEKTGPHENVSTTEIKEVKAFAAKADTFAAPTTYAKGSLKEIVAPGM